MSPSLCGYIYPTKIVVGNINNVAVQFVRSFVLSPCADYYIILLCPRLVFEQNLSHMYPCIVSLCSSSSLVNYIFLNNKLQSVHIVKFINVRELFPKLLTFVFHPPVAMVLMHKLHLFDLLWFFCGFVVDLPGHRGPAQAVNNSVLLSISTLSRLAKFPWNFFH